MVDDLLEKQVERHAGRYREDEALGRLDGGLAVAQMCVRACGRPWRLSVCLCVCVRCVRACATFGGFGQIITVLVLALVRAVTLISVKQGRFDPLFYE